MRNEFDEALESLTSQLSVPSWNADPDRERRKGVPEIVLAEGKAPDTVVEIARHLVARSGRAIVSRVGGAAEQAITSALGEYRIERHPAARMLVVRDANWKPRPHRGSVGILSAGTSDVPVAEEARVIALEMGCTVETAYDVGVAGLHRLVEPLNRLRAAQVAAIVVAAGMDGALPSVVSGLVDVPVIGLPTSVGYGAGGRGLAALLTMLQTCSPGLVVVNIDNGVGAGATAALIARQSASDENPHRT